MSRSTSLAFRQAAYAQETDKALLVLMEIDHPDWAAPVRVSTDNQDTVSGGQTYKAYPFEIVLPSDTDDRPPRARLRIDNVAREIVDEIRTTQGKPSVTMKVVLHDSPDTVEAEFTDFELQEANYDALTVEGEIGVEHFMNEPVPGDSFTPGKFPGLF